jgi:murein DD-endopeptidase MepM/ murein hydrolase activator NlpD
VTPSDILDRLEGKQVIIDHGNGVRTIYAHLDEIAPGVVTGATVQAGQVIGSVGVTGTEGESRPGSVGAHLHFEVWLGDRYLGFGITVRETMWWYEQIFPPGEGEEADS